MENKILKIFLGSNLEIKSLSKLKEYIAYCINSNQNKRIKFNTSYHHILPKAKGLPFERYSNLSTNKWNGSHLLHANHYKAYHLLYEAIEHISIVSAFAPMNKQDISKGKIDESCLISPEEYELVIVERSKLLSDTLKGRKPWNTGKEWSEEIKLKISESKKAAGTTIVKCPYCDKKGGNQAMGKYHFDNCVDNPNNTITKESRKLGPQKKVECPHCNKMVGYKTKSVYHFNNCKKRMS